MTQKGKVIGIFHWGERAHLSEQKNTHFALYSVPKPAKIAKFTCVQFFFVYFGRAQKSENSHFSARRKKWELTVSIFTVAFEEKNKVFPIRPKFTLIELFSKWINFDFLELKMISTLRMIALVVLITEKRSGIRFPFSDNSIDSGLKKLLARVMKTQVLESKNYTPPVSWATMLKIIIFHFGLRMPKPIRSPCWHFPSTITFISRIILIYEWNLKSLWFQSFLSETRKKALLISLLLSKYR